MGEQFAASSGWLLELRDETALQRVGAVLRLRCLNATQLENRKLLNGQPLLIVDSAVPWPGLAPSHLRFPSVMRRSWASLMDDGWLEAGELKGCESDDLPSRYLSGQQGFGGNRSTPNSRCSAALA